MVFNMLPETPSTISSERLTLLYQLSQTFNSSLDLDDVLNKVIDSIITVLHAERGFVVLCEQGTEWVFRAARGMGQTTINDPELQISRGIVNQTILDGKPVLTSNAQMDSRFSGRQSVNILGLTSILCAPLKARERCLGAVYLENRLQAGIFSQGDLELLESIASTASIAVENARLYQVAVEKGRMERELQVARQVQSSFIPGKAPKLPGWEIAASWIPAREVAGDFYDFFQSGQGKLNLVIADVADKGMGAALFMVNCRSAIRATMMSAASLTDGIAHVNQALSADSTSGMFLTLFFAQIDLKTAQVEFINAGHNPPLVYRRNGSPPAELNRTGMALGVEANGTYQAGALKLNAGDMLLLYTDGLTDAINSQIEAFGLQRLQLVASSNRQKSAQEVVDRMVAAINEFTGSAEPFDDITMMVVKRL
jgi:sigma-B regulation protein RsbU (phosphoserine phosphatase)